MQINFSSQLQNFIMQSKILLVYNTPQFKCYQASKLLVVWVHRDGQILFGNAVPADNFGLAEAQASALHLRKEDVEHPWKLCGDGSLRQAFEESIKTRMKMFFSFPNSTLKVATSYHDAYGRRIIFRQDQGFACLYYRRFCEFLGLLGMDCSCLNTSTDTPKEITSQGCDLSICSNWRKLDTSACEHSRYLKSFTKLEKSVSSFH